jgi:hypothetical protein
MARKKAVAYEALTFAASGNLTVTNNGSTSVDIAKTSGSSSWDNHAYASTAFTAPVTVEFNKLAESYDNSASYAMISLNEDPTSDASYSSLDYASYPYRSDVYSVYHNGSQVHFSGSYNTALKFYIVYATNGYIYHYNGSNLLYSVNWGGGRTVYIDSSFYSVNGTYSRFYNVRAIRKTWNGSAYV